MDLRSVSWPGALKRLGCAALALAFAGGWAWAQDGADAASLKNRVALAQSALAGADLDEQQRKDAKAALDAASQSLTQAETLRADIQRVQAQAKAAVTRGNAPGTAGEGSGTAAWSQWLAGVPETASVATLESLLAREQQETSTLRQRIDNISRALADAVAQPGLASDALAELRQRADASEAPAGDAATPPALQQAVDLRRAARREAVQTEIRLRELEQETAGARQNALEQELQSLRETLALHEPRVAWLNQRVAQQSLAQLQDQADQLKQQADALAGQDTPAANLARDNADLARQLQQDTLQLASERTQLNADERERETVSTVLRDARARLSLGGGSAATGQWLWQQRLATPSVRSLALRRRDVQARLSELRLRQYNLSDMAQRLTTSASGSQDDALLPLRLQQQRLMRQLSALLGQRIVVLEQSDRLLASLVGRGGELRRLMSQELLWVPSHSRIDAAWLAALPRQLAQGTADLKLGTIARLASDDVRTRPLAYLLVLALVAALFRLRRHARLRTQALAERMRDVLQDRFAYTAQAMGWALVQALPWPVLVGLLGSLLATLGAGRVADVESLGQAMVRVSGLILGLAVLRALLAPDGLADAHLRWPRERLRILRRGRLAAAWIVLPMGFLGLWALNLDVDAAVGVQTRLTIMLIAAGMGALLFWLLRREQPWPGLPRPLRRALYWLLPGALLLVVVLAAGGYVYSGAIVLDAILRSLLVTLLVQVVYGLLKRWMLLGERRLALQQRQAEQHSGPDVADLEAGERRRQDAAAVELVTVSAQTRRLLHMARAVLLLIGVVWAWSDVLPALLRLDSIELWHFSEKDAGGQAVQGAVSLADFAGSLLILAVGWSLARNVPGIVELLLSPAQRISASARYTISTLLRYGVTIVATLAGLSLLGLRWSQLQWMAAALTVGLGFGLQEIFANFVSGLILLVERPFRVGDTITIDGISGSVKRIRTRATVVQDWDNKEIIIPNKTFLTSQVTNWTLSDDVTRVTLPVGVAYGSPIARVHELLVQAAQEQPDVLKDPPPRSWFMAFGNSTLDFELRVFVAGLGNRLMVQNALLARIAELFEAEGIEIAFPQMDVHVRDWPAPPPDTRA